MTLDGGQKTLIGALVALVLIVIGVAIFLGWQRDKARAEVQSVRADNSVYRETIDSLRDGYNAAKQIAYLRDSTIAALTARLDSTPLPKPIKIFIHEEERAAFASGLDSMWAVHRAAPVDAPLDPRGR